MTLRSRGVRLTVAIGMAGCFFIASDMLSNKTARAAESPTQYFPYKPLLRYVDKQVAAGRNLEAERKRREDDFKKGHPLPLMALEYHEDIVGRYAAILGSIKLNERCQRIIIDELIAQDGVSIRFWNALNPDLHFDNCRFDESASYVTATLLLADKAASAGNYKLALQNLGRALHPVQDFYSHTNYIEISTSRYSSLIDVPVISLWTPTGQQTLIDLRKAGLISGNVWYERVLGPSKCPPGTPAHSKLNKDNPLEHGIETVNKWTTKDMEVTYFLAALFLGTRATANLLEYFFNKPEWMGARRLCTR